MVHGLVHPAAVGDEPVVDASERGQHAAPNTRLLGDFTDCGLFGRLALLDVALGQRPQHPSTPIDAPDQRRDLLLAWPVDAVDDQPAGGCFVHGAQPLRHAARRSGPAGFGRCRVVGHLAFVMVLGRAGSATTPAPPPTPTRFCLFAVRHPSDSSWHGSVSRTYSPLARCATARRACGRPRHRVCFRGGKSPPRSPPWIHTQRSERTRDAASAGSHVSEA